MLPTQQHLMGSLTSRPENLVSGCFLHDGYVAQLRESSYKFVHTGEEDGDWPRFSAVHRSERIRLGVVAAARSRTPAVAAGGAPTPSASPRPPPRRGV